MSKDITKAYFNHAVHSFSIKDNEELNTGTPDKRKLTKSILSTAGES